MTQPASPVAHTARTARLAAVLCGTALLALVGCAADEPAPAPEPEPEPVVVENAALGIAIVDLPEVLVVAENEGDTLRLVPAPPATDDASTASNAGAAKGEITVHVRIPETGGVNLVAAWQAHKADIEARTEGEYKGQNELVTQLGPAFYSRGRYVDDDGSAIEETKVFALHPSDGAMLELSYRYPAADDTVTRLQEQLFVVLGAIEASASAAPESVGADTALSDDEMMGEDAAASDETAGDAAGSSDAG